MNSLASVEAEFPSSPSPPPSQQSSTPKRKRNGIPQTSPASSPEVRLHSKIPSRPLTKTPDSGTGTESPRSKVAYEFQDMHLEDGVTISKFDLLRPSIEDESLEEGLVRKRLKVVGDGCSAIAEGEKEIPETQTSRDFKVAIRPEQGVDATVTESAGEAELRNTLDPMIFKGSYRAKPRPGLTRAYPSINRLFDSKSRAPKKRMDTPPLIGSTDGSLDAEIDEAERRVVDPDRAALTWHENEITGHNPDDPDDDGEGINGIGFRPTPAMAYARSEKRRLQMAEYRNREAREARAKRSERRRGGVSSKEEREIDKAHDNARRVRFLEGMVEKVIPTN